MIVFTTVQNLSAIATPPQDIFSTIIFSFYTSLHLWMPTGGVLIKYINKLLYLLITLTLEQSSGIGIFIRREKSWSVHPRSYTH